MKTLLTANLSTKVVTDGGATWTPPQYRFGETVTLALRFAQNVAGNVVEPTLDIRAMKASYGSVDLRPASGTWTLQVGAGAQTGANTTGALQYDCTPDALAAAINAKTGITGVYGTASVKKMDGTWTIVFGTGAAEVPVQVRDNLLFPVSFGRIAAYAVDGIWRHEVRLTQAPLAFSDAGSRILPDAPSVTRVRAGATDGGFTYNEIQSLFVPPDFRGTYQLKFGDYARTQELSVADDATTIQAALAAAYGDDFKVTNPQPYTATIEFVNALAASAQALIVAQALNTPPGDYTFTLALDRAELASRLKAEETITAPLEVWLQLADSDDNLTWVLAFAQDVTVARPVTWQSMELVPGVNWLIAPSPTDYVPFSRESVITGQQFARAQVGDGEATSFAITHGLATNYVFAWVRVNASPGAQLIEGTDYSVTIVDANSVTVTALGTAPTTNHWLVTIVSAQTVAAFAAGLNIDIAQVNGLQAILDSILATLAQFQTLIPDISPGAATGNTVLAFDLPPVTELYPGTWPAGQDVTAKTLHGRRFTPAIHDDSVTSLTTLPLPTATDAEGSVYQNNTGATIALAGGLVADGGFFGSDGIALYPLSRSGSSVSYFPTALERELWRIEINDEMLWTGKTLTVNGVLNVRTVAANTDLQMVLVVEWGNITSQSSPVGTAIAISSAGTGTHTIKRGGATLGTFTVNASTHVVTITGTTPAAGDVVQVSSTGTLPTLLAANTDYVVRDLSGSTFKLAALTTATNLEDIEWQTSTPLLSERIIIAPVLQPCTYGVTIARSSTEITVNRLLYGGALGVAFAPASGRFSLRARMFNFDTRNSVTSPKGLIYYTHTGTAAI